MKLRCRQYMFPSHHFLLIFQSPFSHTLDIVVQLLVPRMYVILFSLYAKGQGCKS